MKKFYKLSLILNIFIFLSNNFIDLFANPIPSGSAVTIVGPTTITLPGNYRFGNDFSGTLTIDADNVKIDMENRQLTANGTGIIVNSHADITIKNGIIDSATQEGIDITNCFNINISEVDFTNNGSAVNIVTSTCVIIENCSINNSLNGDGVVIETSTGVIVQKNKITNTLTAILLRDNSVGNIIQENVCSNNFMGIDLINTSSQNQIIKNTISDSLGDGIRIQGSSSINNIVKENVCCNNQNGINLVGADNNTLEYNSFFANRNNGMMIISDENTIIGNISNNNTIHGMLVGSTSGNNCIAKNIFNHNGSAGVLDSVVPSSYFLNKAQQNTINYIGVSPAVIAIFDISSGVFVSTPTFCCDVNISVVS